MGTFFDDASLVMIPSGVKESKLYSIKPTDGTGDFTFTRGTDTATRVNSAGLIEKETQNLLLQSNTFDTTWANTNTTETSGQSGYDGSSNAWLLAKNAAFGRINQSISSSGVHTFSVYAKEGTSGWMRLVVIGTANPSAYFNLSNGAVGTTSNVIESNSQNIGNGWYRYSISLYQASITEVRIYPAEADNDIGGTSGNIYIQDAQLEQSLVARTYIETTTAAVYAGITDNLPRLDYSGGATCPSLLLEPQRSNIMPSSEDIDSVWSKLRVSVENNNTTSPEGFVNAGKTTATAVAGTHASYDTLTGSVTAGNDYFISCFVKKATTKYIRLNEGYTGAYVTFNFDDQTTDLQNGASDVLLEEHANGWYRLGFKFTADSSGNSQFALYINDDNNNTSYTGSGEAVYLWGAQVEAGSYPTSYIPCMGVSATRAKDVCNKTSATSIIGQTEGTIFIEGKINADNTDDYNRIFGISQGNDSYRIIIFSSNQEELSMNVKNAGNTEASITSTISPLSTFKAAIGYAANDFVFYVNGQQIGTDNSGSVPACHTISLGTHEDGSGTRVIEGGVNQALLFKTRLTNAELADLTTL